jgi:hypothetical protein
MVNSYAEEIIWEYQGGFQLGRLIVDNIFCYKTNTGKKNRM